MKLLDNPTVLTKEGVLRALNLREIATDQGVSEMVYITALLWLVTAVIVALPCVRRSRALFLALFIMSMIASIPMFVSFMEMDFVFKVPKPLSMMDIFHLCDGIIIMFGYAYGVSYEAANLIVFAVVQPTIIIYLTVMCLLNHRNKFSK